MIVHGLELASACIELRGSSHASCLPLLSIRCVLPPSHDHDLAVLTLFLLLTQPGALLDRLSIGTRPPAVLLLSFGWSCGGEASKLATLVRRAFREFGRSVTGFRNVRGLRRGKVLGDDTNPLEAVRSHMIEATRERYFHII